MRRLLLRLALGRRTFDYMVRTLTYDYRLRSARDADIIVRKDGVEQRIEADWLKTICRIVTKAPGRAAGVETRKERK